MSLNVWSVCICLLAVAQPLVSLNLIAQHRSLTRITFVTEGVVGRTNEYNPAIWNHADSIRFHIGLHVETPHDILELTSPTVSFGLASSRTAISVSLSSQSVDVLSVLDLSLGLSHRYLLPRVAWGVRLGIERWKRGVLRTRSRPYWSVGAIWLMNDLVSIGFTSSKSSDVTTVQFAPDRHTLGIVIKHGPHVRVYSISATIRSGVFLLIPELLFDCTKASFLSLAGRPSHPRFRAQLSSRHQVFGLRWELRGIVSLVSLVE